MKSMRSRKRKTPNERLEDKVKKAFRAELEPWERKYIADNPEEFARVIKQMANEIRYAKEVGKDFDVRKAFRSQVNYLSRHEKEGTRRDLFKILKRERHADYNHLNTYLYRLGYNVANYWGNPENSDLVTEGSAVYMTLHLPVKTTGSVIYTAFEFDYDYSDGEVITSEFI